MKAEGRCKVCGTTENLKTVTVKGKTYNREYCVTHYAEKKAQYRGTKAPGSRGRKRVVVVAAGVIRHTIHKTKGVVITNECGQERSVNYRKLKRIKTPKAIEKILVGFGFEVIKRTSHETVLEKRIA